MNDDVNAERTPDGHHVVVNGRKWRATDPGIPEKLRAELVAELMRARRGVRAEGDAARHRVHDAKVALGERGDPWWETPTPEGLDQRILAAYRVLIRHRPKGTVCPSEVARIVGGADWRSLSSRARTVAWEAADEMVLEVLQKGERVERGAKGPVRVGRGKKFPDHGVPLP